MAFSLRLRISRCPTLNIFGKTKKGRKQSNTAEQDNIDKRRDKTAHSLPATSGQQEKDNNQKTTTAAGLVVIRGVGVLALHGKAREKGCRDWESSSCALAPVLQYFRMMYSYSPPLR